MRQPTEQEYHAAKYDLALYFAPQIKPCEDCGWPVAEGYICFYCRDEAEQKANVDSTQKEKNHEVQSFHH